VSRLSPDELRPEAPAKVAVAIERDLVVAVLTEDLDIAWFSRAGSGSIWATNRVRSQLPRFRTRV
jgi:hypothetical protein